MLKDQEIIGGKAYTPGIITVKFLYSVNPVK